MKKILMATAASALLFVSAQASAADGEKVFNKACFACHKAGIAGAPKVGSKEAWAPRIAQGMDTLKQHALGGYKGKTGFMPPKGGRGDLSDDDVKAAVEYMVSKSQ